ncbi:MAG: hypothetical protein A2X59_03215 [Nitrospirae bacterium GWC2_42_7]|nr:MAG: hypothetical protein A2X59_03215 [Nitrospirae bacterium GWC2_42_7]
MEKKKKKTPIEISQLGRFIVEQTTMDVQTKNTHPSEIPMKEKNPAAVALGRLGGLKGGKARVEKLSAKKL